MNQRPYLATFPRTRGRHASHCPSLLYEVPGPTTNGSSMVCLLDGERCLSKLAER